MQSINEGILKIPPEQKEKLRDFYGSLKSQVQALEKDGKIPLFEMMRVVKSFEDFDLSANPRARLSIRSFYDYNSDTVGGIIWADYRNAVIVINIPRYSTVEKVLHPDEIVKYGNAVITHFNWPDFLSTLVHETVHFLQQTSDPDKTPVTLATPRKSYMRNPFEQQAWAIAYLEGMKEKLGNADPNLILRSLRQHGVIDDDDLKDLKGRNLKAWKGVMKQAIMSAMAELEGTGKLPWQTNAKLP